MGWSDLRYEARAAAGDVIWRAHDRLRDELCILKRPAPDQPGALEREHAELVRLRHPAIRALTGALRDERGAMLVLEHIEGDNPIDVVRESPNRVDAIAIALLRALLHLHERERVHGDLKPANVIVDARGQPRLIDLGLCVPIGGRVAGGTGGFIAPELLRGGRATVASDVFAFARTVRTLGGAPSAGLRDLIDRASSKDPDRRPASAAAMLAELGELALPADRAGVLPWIAEPVLEQARACLRARLGQTLVIKAPRHAGCTRLSTELQRDAAARWQPLANLELVGRDARSTQRSSALERFGAVFDDEDGRLSERSMRSATRAAGMGLGVVVDNASAADEDEREAFVAMARAIGLAERGALIIVGASADLARRMSDVGARSVTLVGLDAQQVNETLERAGARAPAALAKKLHAASGGLRGLVAEAALRLAREPETTDEALLDAVRKRRDPTVHLPPTPSDPSRVVERAREALDRGAPHRAERILMAGFERADEDARAAPLLARAWARSGRLDRAVALLETLDAVEDRRLRASLYAQLGRHDEVLAITERETEAEDHLVAASSALALGQLKEVHRRLDAALAQELEPGLRARLLLLRSDAALRANEPALAIEHAEAALALSHINGAQAAESHSRLGSALALRGDARAARIHHARALEAIEATADIAQLPPYVINLATAHHAVGELGTAIARYEEGARLAERLGRVGMRAAALVNLGGLLVHVGARDEAAAVLEDARRAAEESGVGIYAAQARLIEAERIATDNRSEAVDVAELARLAFVECGAERQALEADLLIHELRASDPEDRSADSFCSQHGSSLAAAGLGARAQLLRARVALDADRVHDALRFAECALEEARDGADSELEARAWAISARAHRRSGSPDAARRSEMAAACLERVAQTLPAGLRSRFLTDPARVGLLSSRSATGRSNVQTGGALGQGGRRLLVLLRRVLLDGDERRVLEAAVDEAIALTRAERAFLLRRRGDEILIARNLDRDTIRSGRFSRSVAERVLELGEPVLTQMAASDPELAGARSIADLGLRSILCVPIRAPDEVIGALYLDHRFESARFGDDDLELVQALGDIIGLAIENARLHRRERERTRELERMNAQVRDENVRASLRLAELEQRLSSLPIDDAESAGIVGQSAPMRRALTIARRVAPSDLSVLIEGESGTGKELFARYIHRESPRSEGPFLAINCGALPENLLESELFGHVRGAFTGATRDHPGLFQTARGGTLLLDEIGEMPLRMQTRLLRVLQEREVRAVGAEQAESVDVRILSATNRRLDDEVSEGRFRQDLFFRLVGVRVGLPPLRKRLDDLPLLTDRILERIAGEPGLRRATISRAAMSALLRHDWPGNVRELEQSLRRAILVSDNVALDAEDLALALGEVVDRATAIRRFDRGLVETALRAASGNRTRAAQALGVSRTTLHRWLKRHGLS